jgi:hypothetical protein
MRLRIILFTTISFLSANAKLRAQAKEGSMPFQKMQLPAEIIVVPNAEGTTEDAIKDYMARKGIKPHDTKGLRTYKSVSMDTTGNGSSSDLYFKVERKSKQEKDFSTIYLIATRENLDLFTQPGYDTVRMLQARDFLNRMAPIVNAYDIQVQLNDQNDVVRKAQKKMNGLISDQNDLNKKLRDLQDDLDQNKKDQLTLAQHNGTAQTDEDRVKSQKKMNSLMDKQSSLEKKIRNAQLDLDQNSKDQQKEQQELDKQKQTLEAIKAKQKTITQGS